MEFSEKNALTVLKSGKIIDGFRIPWGSNHTFLVRIDAGLGKPLKAIYKPRDGERPLYDFPNGSLYKREYATFVLSRILGWPNVPLTLIRNGPYGVGALQLYVEHNPEITYFDLIDGQAKELQRLAVFDLLVNNADRKAEHCLFGKDDRVWSIDHGLTFHSEPKLRTVMLEFWDCPIPQPLISDLAALLTRLESTAEPTNQLAQVLTLEEIRALINRLQVILSNPFLPKLTYSNAPW